MTSEIWVKVFAVGAPLAVSLSAATRKKWALVPIFAGAMALFALSADDPGRTIVTLLVPIVGALVAVGSRDPRMTPAGVVGASFAAAGQFVVIYLWQAVTFLLVLPVILLAMRLAPKLPTGLVPWAAVVPTIFLAVLLVKGIV